MARVEDGRKWAAMQTDWQAVDQEALTTQFRVMQTFVKSGADGHAMHHGSTQADYSDRASATDQVRSAIES